MAYSPSATRGSGSRLGLPGQIRSLPAQGINRNPTAGGVTPLQDRLNREGMGDGTGAASYSRVRDGALVGNAEFGNQFSAAMADAIKKREVGNQDPTQRINLATDRIAQSEGGAAADLQKRAAASGYGTGGGIQAGLQGLYEKFSGQKADTAREITQDVEEQNLAARRAEEARMLQALGIAGNQLNSDRAYGLSQQELALRQRAQTFAEQEAARAREEAKQRNLYNAMTALGSGGGGDTRARQREGMIQVVGGGALDEQAKRDRLGISRTDALGLRTPAQVRLDKIINR